MNTLVQYSYVVAAILFIYGLKELSSPATARRGNLISSVGMLLAVVAGLLDQAIVEFQWIVLGIVIGSIIGAAAARMVHMTAMPQMVGILNGFGGGASQLVAAAVWYSILESGTLPAAATAVEPTAADSAAPKGR